MRYPFRLVAFGLFASAVLGLRAADSGGWRPLWNGKDLSGWAVWLSKPYANSVLPADLAASLPKDAKGNYTEQIGARDPLGVFTVGMADGRPAIHISGQVFGELRSAESLGNYHLKLQFKWGQKQWPPRDKPGTQRDSGLLYHVHSAPGAENRTWARSVELQIQERDVGDLYAVGSLISVHAKLRPATPRPLYDYDPKSDYVLFSQRPDFERPDGRCVKQPDAEKPTGDWNTVELVCLGGDSIHIVNGTVVMRLHNARRIDGPTPAPITSGPIILQSEGAEVFYRDISVRPITAIPAEYTEK